MGDVGSAIMPICALSDDLRMLANLQRGLGTSA